MAEEEAPKALIGGQLIDAMNVVVPSVDVQFPQLIRRQVIESISGHNVLTLHTIQAFM